MSSKRGTQQQLEPNQKATQNPETESMIELPILESGARGAVGNGNAYWRSAADRSNDPAFRELVEGEFIPGADEPPSGTSRRQFLQVMGASMALAGLTACRRPVEKIVPFDRKPEELIPGIPENYATAMPFRGHVRGLLVESSDGRPTKIEGNPQHPEGTGSTSVFEQASLLNLYDPDRSQNVLNNGSQASWADFAAFVAGLPASTRLGVIAPPSSSETRKSLRDQLGRRFASLLWVEYESTGDDVALKTSRALFGRPLRPVYELAEARVVVSLDADFLGATNAASLAHTEGFTHGRRVDETREMNRLYVAESHYTLTGGSADHRLRLRASSVPGFAAALARAMGHDVGGGEAFDGHPFLQAAAEDLQAAGSNGVVIPGEGQGQAVHALAVAINEGVGAFGTTVRYLETGEEDADTRAEDLRALLDAAESGRLDALVVLGCNPAYDAPADLDVAAAISATETTIHVGLHVDETAGLCTWHVPETHFLEAWSDGRALEGTRSVMQPLIAPLYDDAHSDIEVLALLANGAPAAGYDLVRATWRGILRADFNATWRRVLHDGFLTGSTYDEVSPVLRRSALPTTVANGSDAGIELVVRLDNSMLDGSFANNAWMQELPDPITKVTWDNVALMNQATADELGVEVRLSKGKYHNDRVSIEVDGRSVDLPVWILPGVAERTVVLTLGYGRALPSNRETRSTNLFDLDDHTDVYGQGALGSGIGANVAALRTSGTMHTIGDASVARSGSGYLVASTQDHGALPVDAREVEARGLFRAADLEEFRSNPDFIKEMEPEPLREAWENYPTLWQENHPKTRPEYQDNDFFQFQWAMTIDLSSCTGCNACLVACQAENNIQVVGKDQVSRGREMHWIRLDRYFVTGEDGNYDEPRMVVQPVPCMQCENAPCEQVCPVAATVHSPDGLNQMVYNRCIGTRYCANNCPYKVRRFNFYNWTKTLPTTVRMAQNPNVTVRSRGVMEKCSYCVQRIREVNKELSVEKRDMRVDEVQTACQQVCPAKAITFGDLGNPASAVNEKRRSRRRYEMLAELNVHPRTSYLARVRNPNPRLGHES